LSAAPNSSIRRSSPRMPFQMANASSSRGVVASPAKTEARSRSLGRPQTSVSTVHANRIASSLK
jgi:hypothetical protein